MTVESQTAQGAGHRTPTDYWELHAEWLRQKRELDIAKGKVAEQANELDAVHCELNVGATSVWVGSPSSHVRYLREELVKAKTVIDLSHGAFFDSGTNLPPLNERVLNQSVALKRREEEVIDCHRILHDVGAPEATAGAAYKTGLPERLAKLVKHPETVVPNEIVKGLLTRAGLKGDGIVEQTLSLLKCHEDLHVEYDGLCDLADNYEELLGLCADVMLVLLNPQSSEDPAEDRKDATEFMKNIRNIADNGPECECPGEGVCAHNHDDDEDCYECSRNGTPHCYAKAPEVEDAPQVFESRGCGAQDGDTRKVDRVFASPADILRPNDRHAMKEVIRCDDSECKEKHKLRDDGVCPQATVRGEAQPPVPDIEADVTVKYMDTETLVQAVTRVVQRTIQSDPRHIPGILDEAWQTAQDQACREIAENVLDALLSRYTLYLVER